QVYKYLDIGTNKEGEWDAKKGSRVIDGISQYLTDVIEPSEIFSAGKFIELAKRQISNIKKKGKVPIVVGGTGLYVRALIDGFSKMPEKNDEIRKQLNDDLKKHGTQYLYKELQKIDPTSAEKNKTNPHRLIRALEVFKITGTPISILQKKNEIPKDEFIQFGLSWPREVLYDKINDRAKQMLKIGMIEETRNVLKMNFSKECQGLLGIGYRSIVKYIDGKIKIDDVETQLQADTRHYAKRQITWFKRDKRINWIEVEEKSFHPEDIADKIIKIYLKV
ncbi:tRNA (adenosine(37)-N6)-dimethylallyltransferase MiaA, partial [Elusimicrobiota bacterium]